MTTTTTVTPYLFFAGACREALAFYASCFGGECRIMTFGDAQGEGCAKGVKDQVMHGTMTAGPVVLMGTDVPGDKPTVGDNVQLAVNCPSVQAIEALFPALAAGGHVDRPLHDAFWGARFGVLRDRYGVRWMLNFERPKQA